MDIQIKRNDIIVCIVAILVSGIALWFCGNKSAGDVVVIATAKEEKVYSLLNDQQILLEDNGRNVVEIKDGQVSMIEADCRDQICVKHKSIYKNGETIICLPNDVYITVKSGVENEIDN